MEAQPFTLLQLLATQATELLIEKNSRLLEMSYHNSETPLDKAYGNMHLETIEYPSKAANDDVNTIIKLITTIVFVAIDMIGN